MYYSMCLTLIIAISLDNVHHKDHSWLEQATEKILLLLDINNIKFESNAI